MLAERSARRREREEDIPAGRGGAVQKFREKLAEEQELDRGAGQHGDGNLRDGVQPAARAESGRRKRRSRQPVMIDAARVFIADAAERVDHEARRALAAVHEGDMLTTQIAVLKRSASAAPWTPSASAAKSPPPSSRKTATLSKVSEARLLRAQLVEAA